MKKQIKHSNLGPVPSSKIQEHRTGPQGTRAFTLVELIVVITILAILWTIAFISLQWYSADARDSSRISDVNHIKTSLELYSLDSWKYPLPDEAQNVTLTWTTVVVWKQWTIWDTVTSQLSRNLNEKPTDPLYETEYIYSTLENGSKYEVMSVYEGDLAYNSSTLVAQTNAASTPTVRVDGTYNWMYVKTGDYIIPTPSIITALDPTWLYLNIATIKSQVINRWTNVPNIWTSKVVQKTWELVFNDFQTYNIALDKDSDPSEFLAAYKALADTYTWSSLANQWIIQALLLQTTEEEKINFTKTVILNTTVASTTPVITETCTDWIQNQDEAWVDCGWSCWACPITCPTWYVFVPNDWNFTTQDFCVAKYEMKIQWNDIWTTTYNSSMVAESRASWTPWVSITQPNAIIACNNLWTWYHLITNNEWMTIARNIEANSGNWANWTIWSIVSAGWWLYRWNVNLNDSASCWISTVLDWNTAWTNCDVSWRNKRKLILSNWNEIWDISWNVWEHVNGTNNISSTTWEVSDWNACSVNNRYSWNSLNDGSASCTFTNTTPTYYSKANHWPAWDYNANNWVWRLYSSTSTNRIFIRGGIWHITTYAGVFTLNLNYDSSYASTLLGFRCAFSVN